MLINSYNASFVHGLYNGFSDIIILIKYLLYEFVSIKFIFLFPTIQRIEGF